MKSIPATNAALMLSTWMILGCGGSGPVTPPSPPTPAAAESQVPAKVADQVPTDVASSSPAASQPAKTLRWMFQAGDTLNYSIELKQTQKFGPNVLATSTTNEDITCVVDSVDVDGLAQITRTVNRLQFKLDGLLGKIDYDSTSDKEPEGATWLTMRPMMMAMKNGVYTFKLSPRGQFSDIVLPEVVLSLISENPALAQQLGVSEETAKEEAMELELFLPADAVSSNASWTLKKEPSKQPHGMVQAELTFTYQGTEERETRSLEKLVLAGKYDVQPDPDALMKGKPYTSQGVYYFDSIAGRMVEARTTATWGMEISQAGQVIEMTTENTKTFKLKPAGDSAAPKPGE